LCPLSGRQVDTEFSLFFVCHLTLLSITDKNEHARGLFERSEFRSARSFKEAHGIPLKAEQQRSGE
jgi:hypothetical protein